MPWIHVAVTTSQNYVMLVEELFESLGALSTTYSDAATGAEAQPLLEPAPNEIKLWHAICVSALFTDDIDTDLLTTAVNTNLQPAIAATLKYQTIEDQVWERAWRADFPLRCFGNRLWICPDGLRPTQANAVIIDLDPGLAFGTGSHPTTAMCLSWLDQADITGHQVLDYGCGSGILAIAAARLGAAAVTAIDYDPQALQATRTNAINNAVLNQLHIIAPDLCPKKTYDCVLANILAETLIALEPQLAYLTHPGSQLVLSGILDYQVAKVVATYQKHFAINPPLINQEWALVTGIRQEG